MRVQGTASNSVEVNQERLLGGGDVQAGSLPIGVGLGEKKQDRFKAIARW